MKDTKILVSSLCIICSFFIGYLFANREEVISHQDKDTKIYINIEQKGKNIRLDTENPDVILLLNGQETSSGSIILK